MPSKLLFSNASSAFPHTIKVGILYAAGLQVYERAFQMGKGRRTIVVKHGFHCIWLIPRLTYLASSLVK